MASAELCGGCDGTACGRILVDEPGPCAAATASLASEVMHMTEPLAPRIRARVTVTLEGPFSGASAGAVRAVLSSAARPSPDASGVRLVTVDDVEIVGRAEDMAPKHERAAAVRDGQDLAALARSQGVTPVSDFDDVLGDFWPDDETADDVIRTVRAWRRDET